MVHLGWKGYMWIMSGKGRELGDQANGDVHVQSYEFLTELKWKYVMETKMQTAYDTSLQLAERVTKQ